MARQWHLSEKTIVALLKPYCAEGKLIRRPGLGTRIGPEHKLPEEDTAPKPSAPQTLASLILKRVYDGSIRSGEPLPPIKYWSTQFRVGPQTVQKAYHVLQKQGSIHRIGKRFYAGTEQQMAGIFLGRKEVLLFVPREITALNIFTRDQYAMVYRLLDRELSHHGYRLNTVSMADAQSFINGWEEGARTPYGIMFWNVQRGASEEVSALARTMHRAVQPRTVPILIDSLHSTDYRLDRNSTTFARYRLLRYDCMSLLTTLLQKGIGSFRYGDFFHNQEPVARTLAYENKNVYPPFEISNCDIVIEQDPRLTPLLQRRMMTPNPVEYHSWRSADDMPVERVLEQLRRLAVKHAGELEKAHKALKGILWVCPMSWSAALLYLWAEMNTMRWTKDISLICFEDDPLCAALGISSMCYDWRRLSYLMAHVLINDIPIEKSSRRFLRFSARLLERDTS